MEASQGVELTSTNKPFGLARFFSQGKMGSSLKWVPFRVPGNTAKLVPIADFRSRLQKSLPVVTRSHHCTRRFSRRFARDGVRHDGKRAWPRLPTLTSLVAMAEGPHPNPSRTRSLSLPAPMVLQGPLCGRVGRRQNYGPLASRGPSFLVAAAFGDGAQPI